MVSDQNVDIKSLSLDSVDTKLNYPQPVLAKMRIVEGIENSKQPKNRAKIEILRNLARFEGVKTPKQPKNRAKIEILRNLARFEGMKTPNQSKKSC